MHDNLSNGVAAITVAAARKISLFLSFVFSPKQLLIVISTMMVKKAAGSSSDQQRRDLGGVMSLETIHGAIGQAIL
ncbi:hypothetical protein CUMW_032520 [Citrus unshiu]|nr:hypothetical protein CUMW_032520 [Citrus unshiu]